MLTCLSIGCHIAHFKKPDHDNILKTHDDKKNELVNGLDDFDLLNSK